MKLRRRTLVAVIVAASALATLGVLTLLDSRHDGGGRSPGCPGLTPAASTQGYTIATGLCVPWGLAFLPDGTALVSERNTARVISVSPDRQVSIVQEIADAFPKGEAGLLGLAVSASYPTDRWVYAYYTTRTDNRIVRFHLGQAPEPILTGLPFEERHDGGRIAFGPDGMLYATVGDTDRREQAQSPASPLGKILRLTPEGRPAPGNPIPGNPMWSLGHRNLQGLAWDNSRRLFAAEFGQDLFDELNLIEPGRNYGWPRVEGVTNDSRFVDPIATWAPADASPSGLAIIGDRAYLGCLRGQRLIRVNLDGSDAQSLFHNEFGRIRTVAAAPDGALWILTSNRDPRGRPIPTDDRILRIPPADLDTAGRRS